MGIDLTGGLDADREYVFAKCPDIPEMREAVNMWVSDDRGVLGLPRFAVEAVAPQWDSHDLQVNIAFPDGRVYRLREPGPRHDALGPVGLPTVFGAGPLEFRCVEPFRVWTASFSGTATETTTDALIAGNGDGPRVAIEFFIEATMAVPPWIQGEMSAQAAEQLESAIEGQFMGGPRYEQLFRAQGTLRIGDGEQEFTGSGLRIRRQGIRNITGFWGHCWQSALFPSGKAFGYIAYPPRPDGSASLNEGFVYEGDGALIPAVVIDAPWLRTVAGNGEDVSVVLESALGTTEIDGQTVVSTYELAMPEYPDFPVLSQSGARYTWDGEVTYGMMERSSPPAQITRD